MVLVGGGGGGGVVLVVLEEQMSADPHLLGALGTLELRSGCCSSSGEPLQLDPMKTPDPRNTSSSAAAPPRISS